MKRKTQWFVGGALALALAATGARAGVSAQDAARLKNDLTPFGSVRAGNSSGTIPAWDGGLKTAPKGYHKGDHDINPFPDDKVLFRITAKNVDQYKDHLSQGVVALIKQYPSSFWIPVYRSRRTQAVPQWLEDNTRKNATRAKLVQNGSGLKDAVGGYPFPILYGDNEKKAQEVMWNHLTRWRGVFVKRHAVETVVQPDGNYSLTDAKQHVYFHYDDPSVTLGNLNNLLLDYLSFVLSPPRLAGGAVLVHEPVNQLEESRQAWGYNAGQRRVRRAPNLAYDSPLATAENLETADDVDQFNGALDRYNWHYLGTREIYIPYNNYILASGKLKYSDILKNPNINPAVTRWELHRVHVVEADLKKGARHIYKKRVFYIDADSWGIALEDRYDDHGKLWRVSMAFLKDFYQLPGIWTQTDVYYDLQAHKYYAQGMDNEESSGEQFFNKGPGQRYFSPFSLRMHAVR